MKTKNKRNYQKQSGITLIALVITIAVLLILAAVSISALFEDSGIIDRAKEAQNETNKAIVYIQAMGNANYANQTDGNGTLKNTGSTGDEKCKIFDMTGNTREWTTEYSTYTDSSGAYPCTRRVTTTTFPTATRVIIATSLRLSSTTAFPLGSYFM